ncbi:carbohydrate ABC transporter permease [Cohnella rhizosphaerae]|uniref:Carbohydrate ABC transporter permease n=1 Tax=Cohnella rhizosphaerae TaxID=1457232 RepID=A0A9X4QR43_9BACL|nr:carbohydrate ABC transporter permease [Cohnella rhizosphaerae]MDG0808210.1 carbohydrate ABC transporter permease [Cohnella rhizosphaerae]
MEDTSLNRSFKPGSGLDDRIFDLAVKVFLLLIGLMAIYPLWFVIIASVSNPSDIFLGRVFVIPSGLNTEAYEKLWHTPKIWTGYRNSILYTAVGTFINLAVTLPAAFALSRKTLPGRGIISMFFIFTMIFGGGLIPTFMLIRSLHMVDSIWALVIPGALSAFNMIIARSFFEGGIPESIYEAAIIDGASKFQFFFRFALPLSKAMIAVIFLYYALSHWNDYFSALIYIRTPDKQPLTIIISQLVANVDTTLLETMPSEEAYHLLMEKSLMKYAVVFVGALPMILLYPFLQKYLIQGVMLGAVKG